MLTMLRLYQCGVIGKRILRTSINKAFSSKGSGASTIYFHISPSGDWWTGKELFAAKHLQPDYVKSIPIPSDFDPHHYFGEEEDDDNNVEDGDIEKEENIHTKEATNTMQHQQPKPNLSYEEKQQLLFKIYDEGEIPVELLTKGDDC